MKNNPCYRAIFAALLCLQLPVSVPVRGASGTGSEGDCDARCSVLEGEARYKCLKTCVSTRKKHRPAGENRVKEKIRDCESACEQHKGIDNIVCRRLCLHNKRFVPRQKKESAAQDTPSPCESRCRVLTGPNRDNCLARCEKKSRTTGRGGTGR